MRKLNAEFSPGMLPEATDLQAYLLEQIEFSRKTFGPGARTAGVTDHIAKELDEIREKPHDLEEWVDAIMLSLDGAWRCLPNMISDADKAAMIAAGLRFKLDKNQKRDWPDWRTADPDKAIEHVRDCPPNAEAELPLRSVAEQRSTRATCYNAVYSALR